MMSKHDPQHLQDELSAYLDGELDDARRAEVEAYLRQDPQARRLLDELSQSAGAVESLDRHAAPGDLVDTVLARMEREQLLGSLGSVNDQDYLDAASARSGYGRWVASAAMVFLTVTVGVLVFRQSQSASDPVVVASRGSAPSPASEVLEGEINLEDLSLAKADSDRGIADGAVLTPALSEMESGPRSPAPAGPERKVQERLRSLGYTDSPKATAKVETPAPAAPPAVELKKMEQAKESSVAAQVVPAEAPAAELAEAVSPPSKSTMPRREEALPKLDATRDPAADQSLEITCATDSARLDQASMIEAFFAENDVEVIEAASQSPAAEGSLKDNAGRDPGESIYIALIDPDQVRQLNAMLAGADQIEGVAWSKQKQKFMKVGLDSKLASVDRIAAVDRVAISPDDDSTGEKKSAAVEPQVMPEARAMRPADVTMDQPGQRGRSDEKTAGQGAPPTKTLRVRIRVISRPPGG